MNPGCVSSDTRNAVSEYLPVAQHMIDSFEVITSRDQSIDNNTAIILPNNTDQS